MKKETEKNGNLDIRKETIEKRKDNLNIKIEPKHWKGFVDDIFVLVEKL